MMRTINVRNLSICRGIPAGENLCGGNLSGGAARRADPGRNREPGPAAGQSRVMDHLQRARIRAGDPDAFGSLFDDYSRAVYNLAFRLTGSWTSAQDVVSLTFLEAWRLRGRVTPDGGPLRPWLLGIAVNVTRNLNRAARRHQAAMVRLPGPANVPDFAEELAGRIDDSAALRRVAAGLAALRPAEREVLALCVWSGLDYAEAASALGIPVGTVRSRLSRARGKLRALAADGGGLARPPGELAALREQQMGDRDHAARPMQEETR
jgi:RNA polymerase sigma factor (sigma-70 family)